MLNNEIKKKYCFNEQYFVGRGIVVSKKDPKNPCEFKKKRPKKTRANRVSLHLVSLQNS
jgi:hypothetical protein